MTMPVTAITMTASMRVKMPYMPGCTQLRPPPLVFTASSRPEGVNDMEFDALMLSRIQFAANISFHILFPTITIALGWLLLSGPLTAAPLLLFANAARQMPLASLGLVQYLSPTLQFLLGVWVFHEPFDSRRLLGFVLIWAGLALVSAQALRLRRRAP